MRKKWLKSNWKRLLVIVVCLALVFVHSTWSQLKFDSINIWLVAIAAGLFLIPSPAVFTPYLQRLKRFKAWQLEFELNEFESKVENAQELVESIPDLEVSKNIPPEVDEVVHEASKDPRAALLLLASKLETALRERLEEANLLKDGRIPTSPKAFEALRLEARSGAFPEGILSAYQDFRQIRNKIAHDYTFQVDDNTIFSLISLGTELLKVLSTEKSDGKEMPPP